MTSRERVLRAIALETPDRTPVDFWSRPDVTRRLQAHLGLPDHESLLQRLRVDLRAVSVEEVHPAFDARETSVLGGDSAYSGKRFLMRPDGSYEDAWGVVRRQDAQRLYDEWITGPLVEDRDLDAYTWPPDDFLEPLESLRTRVAAHHPDYAVLGDIKLPFKAAWELRGLNNVLCDMLVDPEYARELLERVAAYETQRALRLVRAGVDILGVYGDLAMQDRMLVQPKAWRELEKPILVKMIQRLKAERPEVSIFFHSDGDVSEIIEDYLDIGAQVLNPIQPECMDPAAVKKAYGDRLALHGTISLQRTLPNGTPEDVGAEIRVRIETCGENGGLILCPSNLLQPDIPVENIVALYDTPRELNLSYRGKR